MRGQRGSMIFNFVTLKDLPIVFNEQDM